VRSFIEGGSDSWKDGQLQRILKPVRLVNFVAAGGDAADITQRLKLQGLTNAITVHIALAIVGPPNSPPVMPEDYPATPGSFQLIPVVTPPECPRLYLRPVFQDPTKTTNTNVPQAQDIPFGWSFDPEGANEVEIEVDITASSYVGTDIIGTLICVATVMYTVSWQDPKAYSYNMALPRLIGDIDQLPTIDTGSE